MDKSWFIGCSGFHYKDWKGSFYPEKLPASKWFEYYAEHFNTIELNVIFYRFPKINVLRSWYEKCPGGFTFSVKAPRLITHYKKFKDCEKLLEDFYDSVKTGLDEKLGPVLFQLPPAFAYSQDALNLILGQLNHGFLNVIEFRDKSWWNGDVYAKLAERGTIFAGISHPSLPDEVMVNNEPIYYRFHGVPKLYYSKYRADTMKKFADGIKKQKNISRVYVYFNNTATRAAIRNARELMALTGHP